MITEDSFKREKILQFRNEKRFQKIDPILLEKMIYALHLVECLKTEKCDFVFKGGTSLILLFNEPKRFSIDVDIMTQQSRTEIEEILNKIVKNYRFTKFELDEKRSYIEKGIPKAHYLIYYNSVLNNKEDRILLDIIFLLNFYPNVKEAPLNCNFITCDENETVISIPTINSLAGDKLTAFAPNTTGYLYNSGLELQIVKQLFDIGILFDDVDDFSELAKCIDNKIESCSKHLLNKFTRDEILDDVINTGLLIAKSESNLKNQDLDNFNELKRGTARILSFLTQRSFNQDTAIEYAAKAALIAAKVKTGELGSIENHDPTTEYLIENQDYNFLNKRFKKVPTKSMFYWNQTVKILKS